MNKILVILTALLLSGCAAKVSQLQTPEKIEYNGKTYKLTASQDLDTIARYVYLAEPDTLENWQSQIEVLLDRDLSRSIEQRVALREKVYRNLRVQDFKIRTNSNKRKKPATELNGYVIYAPTEQNPSWQVDIAKGKNIPSCGFVQYQYSQKVEQGKKFQRLSKVKIVKNFLLFLPYLSVEIFYLVLLFGNIDIVQNHKKEYFFLLQYLPAKMDSVLLVHK